MRNSKTNELVLTGLFTAIIIIMAFTPLGYIPLVVINATIIHIPVILGLVHFSADLKREHSLDLYLDLPVV